MDDVLSQPHDNAYADPSSGNEAAHAASDSPQRTLQIHGAEFENVGREIVDDLSVDVTYGGMKAWLFCRSGIARHYSIFDDHDLRRRHVREDGLLYDEIDGKGKGEVRK